MPKWLKAKYDTENKIASYTDQQGNFLIRSGGSLPWRLNNPGNLRPAISPQGLPAPKKVKTHIGFAQAKNKDGALSYFLIFPDYETGVNELRNNLHRLHSNKRISEAIEAYAPRKENNTNRYIEQVELFSGLSRNQVINTLQAGEFERLVQAIIRIEGYNDQSKGPRQERLVAASNVTFSDGSRPIANQPAIIQQGGQQKETKTTASGRLPPIVHKPEAGPIDILVKNTKGTLEKVLSIDPTAEAKHYLAVLEQWVIHGSSASHQPNNSSQKTSRPSAQYVVQPGDTLSNIAKIFKSSVPTIQQANNIKNPNRIYPGLRLHIPAKNNAQTDTEKTSAPQTTQQPANTEKRTTTNTETKPTRSKDGLGSPIVLLSSDSRCAPWMEIAIDEAKKWGGYVESQQALKSKKARHKKVNGIIETNYHKEIGLNFPSLETAWCASFVNFCLKSSKYEFEKSASSQFPKWSKKFKKIDKPIYGALVVYANPKKKGQGHVCLAYHNINGIENDFAVLGGNQGDSITLNKHLGTYINSLGYELVGYFVPASYYNFAIKEIENAKSLGEKIKLDVLCNNISIDMFKASTSTR
ncbi:LysM peptidoglycan-binding domain-containing protein [Vogesella oryzae]|uniref:LysM peptidoglycan-binding domain-containing protein n=1 Tax=Vogesella oryzae TaxID=1735285 RepID=UPI0015815F94|nr:LysM peptidoglycan-binding domain-containing protein [Vogesella oryzae]